MSKARGLMAAGALVFGGTEGDNGFGELLAGGKGAIAKNEYTLTLEGS